LKNSSSTDQLVQLSKMTPVSRMAQPNTWSHDGEYAKFWLVQSFNTSDLTNSGVKAQVALHRLEYHPFLDPKIAHQIEENVGMLFKKKLLEEK
ncbi:MAG: hypothetical protein AB7O96_19760, partial [Pseudobdellovibrionaceae bacterium]